MKAVRDPMLPFAAICTNYRTADFLTATRFTANFSNGRIVLKKSVRRSEGYYILIQPYDKSYRWWLA
jgi:hypothetical protein